MPDNDTNEEELDVTIQEHYDKLNESLEQVHFRSAIEIAADLSRLGKREERLMPYMLGLFHCMDLHKDMLYPEKARECAIQLIALLENPEHARSIQGNFPEDEYLNAVATLSTCVYDNLAEATARMEGYNSAGMQQCLAEGIQICHRTGKTTCINCFRDYASEIHVAADDLPMATHHSTMILNHQGEWSGRGDTRYQGARNLAWQHTLMGDLDKSNEYLSQAEELSDAEQVILKQQTKIYVGIDRETHNFLYTNSPSAPAPRPLPPGQHPSVEYRWALCDALRHCHNSDFTAAKDLLGHWDRLLTERRCLSDWFEVRLRLIAAHRLSGDDRKIDALASQLQAKAKKANDYLTLRRLRRLVDPTESVTPVPLLAAPRVGPYAATGVTVPEGVPPPAVNNSPAEETLATTPLAEVFQGYLERLQSSQTDSDRLAILNDILAMPVESFTHPDDAGWGVQWMLILIDDQAPLEAMWEWAKRLAARFAQTSYVISLQATLADILQKSDESLTERIPEEHVEALFSKSLELEPEGTNTYVRAGVYFLSKDNLGEAERCLARGFRLDRLNSQAALNLAKVYRQTDRPRDALAALDLCLREGCDDPAVAWEAALSAFNVEQFESLLTYLDRYDALLPDQPWSDYYRAMGLLELKQPAKALEALEKEEARNPDSLFGVEVLRACAFAALEQPDLYRKQLDEKLLPLAWSTVDTITQSGLTSLASRLWTASACLPVGDPLLAQLEERLLLSGLAPDAMFTKRIKDNDEDEPIKHYRCHLLQPLDEQWSESHGCLNGQAEWPEYHCLWGVLAHDEDEAAELALTEQAKCYPLEARVEEVQDLEQSFANDPGIIWQGVRWYTPEEEVEESAG